MTFERSSPEHHRRSDTARPGPSSLIGQTLGGRYRVTALLGSGGMGAVYQAEHTALKKTVAVKVLNQEMASHREAALRFEREAMVSARIVHPNVVSATDSGRLPDGSLYLVLEYVAGRSLRELIDAERRLPPPRALAIGAQIADALAAAHRADIVHRDLKPSNVMLLREENNTETVKVLDFGLARIAGQSVPGEALTRTGSVFGTPEYMSPEQARGEIVDHRADLYALGVILYELVSGRQPFIAPELVAVLIKHIQEAPPPLPADVPAPLASYIMALLDKDPKNRPDDARQVAKNLRRLSPAAASLSTAPPRPDSAALDGGGAARKGAVKTLLELGWAIKRIEWRELARESRGWFDRLGGSLSHARSDDADAPVDASGPTLAPRAAGRFAWLRQHRRMALAALIGFIVTIALGLGFGMWSREPVPAAVSARASKGEPAALGQIAALPPPDRGTKAAVALATGYFSSGKHLEGIEAVEDALDLDASLSSKPELLRGVRLAAEAPTARVRAIELAAKRLGPAGADLLFDIWVSTPGKTPATRAAREWLDSESVRKGASPALQLALEVRETKTCNGLAELMPRMTKEGDDRSLKTLERLRTNSGCGFLGFEDCYPCLRQGTALDDAIAAVATRAAPKF